MNMGIGVAPAGVSRHKCLIYDGHPSEQLPVVIPLLLDGLQDNWRCLYLGSPDMVRMVSDALTARRVDTAYEMERGALLFSSDRGYLDGGTFDPRAMVDDLCALIDAAVRDGFQGLCATGDMRWELGADSNFDRLLEYEALLEQVFRDKPLRGICQYHRDVIPAQAVRQALVTHQSVYIGQTLNRDNLFYIPPELLLVHHEGEDSNGSKQAEWMCQQILRVLTAEEARDKALMALKESEAHQRHLAEQLAEMNRDLERRVAERTAELRLANQHLEAFSYSVSHDLRSPLGAIIGSCELLEQEFGRILGEQGRKHLNRMGSSAWRMRDLIEALLTLARVAKTDLHREPVNLSALAEEVAREIRESEPERSVELLIHRDLRVVGDATLLRGVLANLLGNAWKFTSKRADARIEVGKTREERGETILYVQDNGAGFEMKSAKKLFGVFQRLHSQDEFPGTGVGLATVQRIISKHGGRIWAESQPGQGATFFFTLPSA
jgi:signal transduction histidine kinase